MVEHLEHFLVSLGSITKITVIVVKIEFVIVKIDLMVYLRVEIARRVLFECVKVVVAVGSSEYFALGVKEVGVVAHVQAHVGKCRQVRIRVSDNVFEHFAFLVLRGHLLVYVRVVVQGHVGRVSDLGHVHHRSFQGCLGKGVTWNLVDVMAILVVVLNMIQLLDTRKATIVLWGLGLTQICL